MSHNPTAGVEKIGFKIDIERTAAFLAGLIRQSNPMQSIATATTSPVAPHVFRVCRVTLDKFLDNVVAVKVSYRP